MWGRSKRIRSIEDGLKAIENGEAQSIKATAVYHGNEYTATFAPKIEDEAPTAAASTTSDLPTSYRIHRLSYELEELLIGKRESNGLQNEGMPWLTLPPGYSFKVTFPFAGAAARFRVCKTESPARSVSVYLDTQHVLGYFGPLDSPQPYWEAYPIGDDAARFALDETKELIEAIVGELDHVPTNNRASDE